MPIVSIILPVYNGDKFLSHAIKSILTQSFRSFELIIVNDCSTDNSLDIIEKYKTNDSRIKVISNKKNLKLPKSLNIGFNLAKGKYFTWTSDDNILKPGCIERLFTGIRTSDVDIVYADFEVINKEGCLEEIRRLDNPIDNLCFENTIGACFLFKKEVYNRNNGFKTNLFLLEDYDFWVRAWINGFKYAHLDEVLYKYRNHDDSLSHSYMQRVSYLKLKYILRMLPAYSKDKFLLNLAQREVGVLRRNFYYLNRSISNLWDGVLYEPYNLYNHQCLAEQLLKEGKPVEAGEAIDDVLVALPDWAVGYVLKSFCHEMMGELDMAIAFQAEAVRCSREPAAAERLAKLRDKKVAKQ